jgi:hypothetical protein
MSINVNLAKLFKIGKDSNSNQSQTEPENEEKDNSKCPHHFGYLAERPKNTPFPEECLLCSKVVECIVKNSK